MAGRWELGVRPDSARTAADIRRALGAYVSSSGTPVPSNLSIRRPSGLLHRTPGELFIAGRIVARSRSFDVLLEALCGHLAALACTQRPAEEPRVRAFTNGLGVVLTDLPRPGLVDDPALAKQRVRELHLWSPEFAEGPVLALPPMLDGVVGVKWPQLPPTMKVAGVVLSAASTGLGFGYGWLQALNRMGPLPTPTTAADENVIRDSILSLLTARR